jgi:hypothetical protein
MLLVQRTVRRILVSATIVAMSSRGVADEATQNAASNPPPSTSGSAYVPDLEKYLVAGASTRLCFFGELRRQIAAEIKKQRRYAAEGAGVIDLQQMYEMQQELRYLDDAADKTRSGLAARGSKPTRCGAELVQKAALCFGYTIINTYLEDGDPDAIERFCASPEMKLLTSTVDAGDLAPYWRGAKQAILNLSYELDRANLVARSAELCISSEFQAAVEARSKVSSTADRKHLETFQRMAERSRRELEEAGLTPLACDDAVVHELLTCVVEKHDDVGVKPGCRSPELKAAMKRLSRE